MIRIELKQETGLSDMVCSYVPKRYPVDHLIEISCQVSVSFESTWNDFMSACTINFDS